MIFHLTSKYKPTGDQPEAIQQLTEGIEHGDRAQVLLGVTGSGKTFTVANVIANVNKPTLILSHNKTLAAQLYEEMRGFFPENAVEYYVSYYDYYQPEAYLPQTDTYIEKDLAINDEIDRLRLSAVSSLLSGRQDVIVVSSVSCIYGMGGPTAMAGSVISIRRGQKLDRNAFLRQLVDALYVRNDIELKRGNFRVKGDTVDVFMAYSENVLRVSWWDDEIDSIDELDSVSFQRLASFELMPDTDIKFTLCDLKCRIQENVEKDSTQFSLDGVSWPSNKIRFTYNTDESKVGPYSLEDPLRFADGRPVLSAPEWRERRGEILSLFEREMYGRIPDSCPVYLDSLEGGSTLAGFGRRKQVRMWFDDARTGPHIDWLILYPAQAREPVPAVILLNYYGNHTIVSDPQVLVPECWLDDSKTYRISGNRASEEGRGLFQDRNLLTVYPVDMILARGYAFVTACYGDVSPDPEDPELQKQIALQGVFDLWPDSGKEGGPRSLGAWAWALMRGMDMIEADPALDASRVLLTGSSRLGKAALLAGAYDERFAAVVLNQTGGGGVPLAKRDFGEHVRSESARFTHWFSPAYAKYAGCEASTMPFDQHLLVSCIAPRPLLVEGFDNPWFDTRGEFLCLEAASPVWRFLGAEGLPDVDWPDDYDTSAIGPVLGYVRRDQGHGIAAIDWTWLLDFADRALR